MLAKWVNLISGVPLARDFSTTSGFGTPIVINSATSTPYYLAAGDVPTAFAGGGGSPSSGTFSLDDGTATASGVFSFDDGAA